MLLKEVFAAFLLVLLIFVSLNLVSAELEIEKQIINEVIIVELDNSAYFNFEITNLEQSDNFELYSLVGVDITPETFHIDSGETKNITVEVKALEGARKNLGYFTFVYKIKSSTGTQKDKLRIKIVNLKDALSLTADSIIPESNKAIIHLQNLENFTFENIEAEFSSAFFNFKRKFSLSAYEKSSFKVDLEKERFSTLVAGPYILNAKIKINNTAQILDSTIKFLEKSGLSTEETKEGWLIVTHKIEKKNEGNLVTLAEITLEKNIISRLFTTFNVEPSKVERQGNKVRYTFQQELKPDETLEVIARTNWHIPIIIIIVIVIIVVLYQIYFTSDLILKKKINFVKTKGSEFALKVSINAKARRPVEKINIIDKLPPVVKLYERYGTITPDRINEKNRKIEWNVGGLASGEDKILSYIIYSKIGIVGKFELPPAKAIYEKQGKIKETKSNRVFFISEPRKVKKAEE